MKKLKIYAGLRFSILGQITSTVLNFVITIILVRLIAPEWFGLVAMVTAFSGFIGMIIPMGGHISLVQVSKIREIDKSSVFYWNVLTGGLGAVLIVLGQSLMELFYQTTLPLPLCSLVAIEVWLTNISLVPLALAQREMVFDKLWMTKIIAQIVGGIVAISLAILQYPLYAIILRSVVIAFLMLIVLLLLIDWFPKRQFSINALKHHLLFGGALTIDGLFGYGVRNIDDMVVGKWGGMQALGYYNKAYSVLLLPLNKVSSIVNSVYFPAFSKLQLRPVFIGKIYLQLCATISSFTFPLMWWFFYEADTIVLAVLGNAWLPAVPIVKVLAILGALQSIGTLSGTLYQSMGRVQVQMQLGLIVKPFMIGTIIMAGWYYQTGLGVAIAYSIASFLAMLPEQYYAIKPLKITLTALLKKLFPAISATLMSLSILLCFPLDHFILRTLIFFFLYLLIYRFLFPKAFWVIMETTKKILKLKA